MKGHKAMTSTERVRKHRKEKIAKGYSFVNAELTPEATVALEMICKTSEISRTEAINRALLKFY